MLIIRDGWGINPAGRDKCKENGDATLLASTPVHDKLYQDYPWSKLSASGADVGLPESVFFIFNTGSSGNHLELSYLSEKGFLPLGWRPRVPMLPEPAPA